MTQTRKLTYGFAAGEVTQELAGRLDLVKNQTGLKLCRNFLPLPHGPVTNRPGTEFVAEVKNSATAARLIPFIFNDSQAFAVCVQAGSFRLYAQGATVLNGAGTAPLEVANSFAAADLFALHYTQSADVMTVVHPGYPVSELRRTGAATWTWTQPTFAPTIAAPGGTPAATATGTGAANYQYLVTTIAADTLEESGPSAWSNVVTNNLATAGNKNTVTWTAAAGAVRYNVYRYFNGIAAYVGTAAGTAWDDVNYTPDVSRTPPNTANPFAAAGDYPGAVAYFEGRRWFAGTTNKPLNVWATRSGTESNLSYSIPTRADDRIAFRAAARRGEAIRHLVPMSALLMMTASAEWRVSSEGTGAITPTNVAPRPQTYVGANQVQPITYDTSVLYAAEKGGRMRALAYDWNRQSWRSSDISKLAPHLFDGLTIVDAAFTRTPYPTLWVVSSSGKLLSLTWDPDEQVAAWAQHDTDGLFESCCAIPEGSEDRLYVIVQRTINGATKRYVERLRSRLLTNPTTDAWFVDCGLQYAGAPVTTIQGLDHLLGKTVNILADGAPVAPQVVAAYVKPDTTLGGQITLEEAASVVTVGLPITADLETLPLATEVDPAFGQGRDMAVNRAYLRVFRSAGVSVGPSFDALREMPTRVSEPYGTPPDLRTEVLDIAIDPEFDRDATVCLRVTDPVPFTLTALTVEVEIGGG